MRGSLLFVLSAVMKPPRHSCLTDVSGGQAPIAETCEVTQLDCYLPCDLRDLVEHKLRVECASSLFCAMTSVEGLICRMRDMGSSP